MLIDTKADVKSDLQGKNFNFELNGKTFKALFSDIYTDKIGSVVREIASNCRDSHVEAGKADVPFDIKIDSVVNFLRKLHESNSYHVIEELLDFVRYNDVEISADGDIICYKVVDQNYKDIYTHSIDNSVGKVVVMNRNKVSDDRDESCSYGLHVASLRYLKISLYGCGSSNNHLMKLSVHPKDFVSVPYDYDGAKARVCEYKIIEEVDMSLIETAF